MRFRLLVFNGASCAVGRSGKRVGSGRWVRVLCSLVARWASECAF